MNKLTKERIKRLIKVIIILLLFTVVPYSIGCFLYFKEVGQIVHIARYAVGFALMILGSILIALCHKEIDYIING